MRGAAKLAATLVSQRADAETFKQLATVRTDAAVGTVDDWEWTGPTEDFPAWCERFGWPRLANDARRLAAARKREARPAKRNGDTARSMTTDAARLDPGPAGSRPHPRASSATLNARPLQIRRNHQF